MQSFIKGLFEGKETETLAQVTHLQLFDFMFIQRCTQLWAAPPEQTVPLTVQGGTCRHFWGSPACAD